VTRAFLPFSGILPNYRRWGRGGVWI